jgi:hypothetical protein
VVKNFSGSGARASLLEVASPVAERISLLGEKTLPQPVLAACILYHSREKETILLVLRPTDNSHYCSFPIDVLTVTKDYYSDLRHFYLLL